MRNPAADRHHAAVLRCWARFLTSYDPATRECWGEAYYRCKIAYVNLYGEKED